MTLLSSANPERVTLFEGLAPRDSLAAGVSQIREGFFYWLIRASTENRLSQFSLGRIGFPSLRLDDVVFSGAYIQPNDRLVFTEPSANRDFIWIAGDSLRRHPLDERGGLLPADVYFGKSDEREILAADQIKMARIGDDLFLFRRADGERAVVGERRSPSGFVRDNSFDFDLPENTIGWDVKAQGDGLVRAAVTQDTVNNVKVSSLYNGNDVIYRTTVEEVSRDSRINFRNVNINIYGDDAPFFVVDNFWRLSSSRLISAIDEVGELIIGYAEIFQLGVTTDSFKGQNAIVQNERLPVFPASAKALARSTGQSVSRLTSASRGVFREVREASVEVSLSQVDELFLLNPEWYFEHKGLTYQMREMARVGDEIIAVCEVG